jgi:hypothetical protein
MPLRRISALETWRMTGSSAEPQPQQGRSYKSREEESRLVAVSWNTANPVAKADLATDRDWGMRQAVGGQVTRGCLQAER